MSIVRWEYRTDVVAIQSESGIDPATGLPGDQPAVAFKTLLDQRLAAAGDAEWELVASQVLLPAGSWVLIFKRPAR